MGVTNAQRLAGLPERALTISMRHVDPRGKGPGTGMEWRVEPVRAAGRGETLRYVCTGVALATVAAPPLRPDGMQAAYRSSALTLDDGRTLFGDLDGLMRSEQLFLDAELDVRRLAKRLATNTTYLSQAVNFFTGGTLPEYLNAQRLRYFENLHAASPDALLRERWREAGFGSYASFYRYVKKSRGATPSKLYAPTA